MNSTTLTSAWEAIILQFLSAFTQPTAQIFANLMTGWILCTARRTITGMLPFADPFVKRTHDAYHRFFSDAKWDMTELWHMLTLTLVQSLCPKGIITVALDDTLFHHSGKKINGAGYWRDAVRSSKSSIVYAWGLNLVVLTIQIQPPWGGEPLGLPITMRLHRKNSQTLIELAQEMIEQVHQWLPERLLRVVADGFYACLAGKEMADTTIISRMKRNAKLYDLPPKTRKKQRGRPRKRGKLLPKPEKMAAHVQDWQKVEFRQRGKMTKRLMHVRKVLWYGVSHKPILLVISRDPLGKEKDDFLFTTDLSMTAAEILECYNDRWAIEDTFKNAKQHLGSQEPQVYKGQGPQRAAALGLWLYSTVWLWYIKQKPRLRYFMVQPWYVCKTAPSFADALSCLRRQLWTERIKFMFDKSAVHDKKFEFLLEALASAA